MDRRTLWATYQGGALYLSYEMSAAIAYPGDVRQYRAYIDADNRAETGYRGVDGRFLLGADYLLEGATLGSAARTRRESGSTSKAVNEWRYKPGTGETAPGITLKVVDMRSGNVIWSASGSRSGWAGSTAAGTAQKLLDQMISKVNFN